MATKILLQLAKKRANSAVKLFPTATETKPAEKGGVLWLVLTWIRRFVGLWTSPTDETQHGKLMCVLVVCAPNRLKLVSNRILKKKYL